MFELVQSSASAQPGVEAPELSWRVLRLINIYRVLASVVLLAIFLLVDTPRLVGGVDPDLFFPAVLAWFAFASLNDFAVTQRWPSVRGQILAQVLADVGAVTVMAHASSAPTTMGNLLVITIAGVSLICNRQQAVTMGAAAALAVLAEQYLRVLQGVSTTADTASAGLLGGILLFLSFAIYPVARRIQESEALARQRGVDLANLGQLNDYIIQNLRESILVVDGTNRMRLMNEAAAKYLGTERVRRGTHLSDISPALLEYVRAWRAGDLDDISESLSMMAADGTTVINPYFAAIGEGNDAALLIFLEDPSLITARVQQSKLAALGRLSASIAHEIRNPVGAMSHAGQLLAENPALGDQERRLTDIIETNARRVSTIVENVLQLSRRDSTRPETIDIADWARDFVKEFVGTMQLDPEAVVVDAGDSTEVRIDASHLHQVVWNLCENAARYAGVRPGETALEIGIGRRQGSDRPYLEVRDRGPGIPADVAGRIFEPFFRGNDSFETGSGLGLFISRELCECNRAALVHEGRPGGGSIFRIIFDDPRRWENRT